MLGGEIAGVFGDDERRFSVDSGLNHVQIAGVSKALPLEPLTRTTVLSGNASKKSSASVLPRPARTPRSSSTVRADHSGLSALVWAMYRIKART